MEMMIEGMLWYIVFLFSVTLHEAAHAYAALRLGDPTAYQGGQVTLEPIPHIRREPLGMVVVPIISFILSGWVLGWGSIPYDFEWALRNPRRAAWMSLAGPMANLFLVFVAVLVIHLGLALGWFIAPDFITFSRVTDAVGEGTPAAVATIISILFSLNLLLFIFNLLPFPPLDGSGIMPLIMDEEKAESYLLFISNPMFSFMGLFIAWSAFNPIFDLIHLVAINLLYPGVSYG